MGTNKMKNVIITHIDTEQFEEAYIMIQALLNGKKNTREFDFLFQCQPPKAFSFIQYCLERRQDNILRLLLCHLLAYGDGYIQDYHAFIYEQITDILSEDSHYDAALGFVIYNYFMHPESPFSDDELIEYSRRLLQIHNDNVAQEVLNTLGNSIGSGSLPWGDGIRKRLNRPK